MWYGWVASGGGRIRRIGRNVSITKYIISSMHENKHAGNKEKEK
jgi:hypothetical protein